MTNNHNTNNRGGSRPGAGAPRGNFNALKTGVYSKRILAAAEAMAGDPNFHTILDLSRTRRLPPGALREAMVVLGRRAGDEARRTLFRRLQPESRDRMLDLMRQAAGATARDRLRTAVARWGEFVSFGDPDDPGVQRARRRLDRLAETARDTVGEPVFTSWAQDRRGEWTA